ncbi:hypothetical protein SGLAM104S_09273 [Streptomyces glaucescens]
MTVGGLEFIAGRVRRARSQLQRGEELPDRRAVGWLLLRSSAWRTACRPSQATGRWAPARDHRGTARGHCDHSPPAAAPTPSSVVDASDGVPPWLQGEPQPPAVRKPGPARTTPVPTDLPSGTSRRPAQCRARDTDGRPAPDPPAQPGAPRAPGPRARRQGPRVGEDRPAHALVLRRVPPRVPSTGRSGAARPPRRRAPPCPAPARRQRLARRTGHEAAGVVGPACADRRRTAPVQLHRRTPHRGRAHRRPRPGPLLRRRGTRGRPPRRRTRPRPRRRHRALTLPHLTGGDARSLARRS